MPRHFSLFLALRYLRPKRTFVSVITLISILGVALGVTALMVVISVMRGFEEKIKEVIMGFEPHVSLFDSSADYGIPDHQRVPWRELAGRIAEIPGVKSTSGMIESPVLIEKLGIDGEPIESDINPVQMIAFPAEEGDSLYQKFSGVQIRHEEIDWIYGNPEGGIGLDPSPLEVPIPPPGPDPDSGGADSEPPLPPLDEPLDSEPPLPPLDEPLGAQPPPPPLDDPLTAPERKRPIFDIGSEFGGNFVVVGDWVSEGYGINPGDRLLIHSPDRLKKLAKELRYQQANPAQTEEEKKEHEERIKKLEEMTLPAEVTVTAVYKYPRYSRHILMNLVTAQELFGLEDQVHKVTVELEDPYAVKPISNEIIDRNLHPFGWGLSNWIQRHQYEFDLIRSERALLYMVLFVLVLVGAFCVMNTMITVTVQKRKEIGVLGALGARVPQIIWIFLSQGIVVGLIGTVAGVGLGSLMLYFRNSIRDVFGKFGVEILPEQFTGLPEIPCMIVPQDLVLITSGSFLLCSLASLIPAYMAARTHPAQTLRSE